MSGSRYQVRYTSDLAVAAIGDDLEELVRRFRTGDFLVHILDTTSGEIVWQSGRSIRFGTVGLRGLVSESVADGILTLVFADRPDQQYSV